MDAQVGQRIQERLAAAGMTQGQLAAALGLTQASVSRKLSGERPWFTDELVGASRVLEISVGGLFGEAGAADPVLTGPLGLVGAAA